MKTIKKKFWIMLWSLLLVICIGFGLITRQSFTDYSRSIDTLMETEYQYHIYPEQWWELKYDNLCGWSDLIVKGTYTGNRTLVNKAFLSEISIEQIYKSDNQQSIPDTISVFEEVEILKLDGMDMVMSPSAYYAGYGLMKEGSEYLFFLRYKGRYDTVDGGLGIDDGSNEYTFVTLPLYSRICLSEIWDNNADYTRPPQMVSLGDSAHYNIFTENKAQMNLYYENVEIIKERIMG